MEIRKLAFLTAVFLFTACNPSDNLEAQTEASEEIFSETAADTASGSSNSISSETETEISETVSETILETTVETAQEATEETTSETSAEPQRVLTERNDLKDFTPFAQIPVLISEQEDILSPPTPRLSEMNESDYYYFANFTFDNEEIIRLLDDAYDVYKYNIQEMNWYFDTPAVSTDRYYAAGISYKSFYEYLSGIFTEELIVKAENGEWNHRGAVLDSSVPPDFKQIDGELYALDISEGIDPGYLGITFSIQEETDDEIIISGVKTGINSTDTGTEDTYIPDMFSITKTENGLRLDSFELWF